MIINLVCKTHCCSTHLEQRVLGKAAALKECHSLSTANQAIAVLVRHPKPVIEEIHVHCMRASRYNLIQVKQCSKQSSQACTS